jgi:predicted transposase YbfD/YdcC
MLLLKQLKQIPDHRSGQGKKYPLWLLMIIVIIGKFCGYDGYRDLADFCRSHQKKLWEFLEIEETMSSPSYSTLRRLMIEMEPQQWEKVYNTWVKATVSEEIGHYSSIDGKSIKCTVVGGRTSEQDFVSLVSVYNHENGGVLQLKVMKNKKVSEIAVGRELIERLKDLSVRQCLTLDALHTQTETVAQIVEANHDYLIAVKENQLSLCKTIEEIDKDCTPISETIVQDNSHGRQVERKVNVYQAPEHLQQKWKGLQSLVVVECQGKREKKDFEEKAYFISSERSSAEVFLKAIQGHWSIENQLHWVKDVTFKEDKPPRQGGHSPVNWAILFSWLITLVRRAEFRTVPQARRLWANQVDTIFALLL